MWRDPTGIIHTISSPTPEDAVGKKARSIIRATPASRLREFQGLLDELESDFYDELAEHPTIVGRPGEYPERPLLPEAVASLSDILLAIKEVDLLWRLEVIESVIDLTDEMI